MQGSFGRDLAAYKRKVTEQLETIVVKVSFEGLKNIVLRSPVDTGRYRANNQVAMNRLPENSLMSFDKRGHVTIAAGNRVLGTYSLGDTVFIANNVAYAVAIEEGHSKRAPSGVYRITALEMVQEFEKVARTWGG